MYNRSQWNDSCGNVVIDAFSEPNGPHGTDSNMAGQYSMPFLDLDQNVGAVDAQGLQVSDVERRSRRHGWHVRDRRCGAANGGMPATGGTGAGGMSASGGMPATGGTGIGGMTSTGGAVGTSGATGVTSGGTGTNAGGTTGGTGMAAGGTTGGTGVTAGGTGMTAGGTGVTTGGTSTGTGGKSASSGGTSTGGKSAGGTSTGGTDTPPPATATGCGCEVPARSSHGSAFAWTGLVAMGAWFARRRREA